MLKPSDTLRCQRLVNTPLRNNARKIGTLQGDEYRNSGKRSRTKGGRTVQSTRHWGQVQSVHSHGLAVTKATYIYYYVNSQLYFCFIILLAKCYYSKFTIIIFEKSH